MMLSLLLHQHVSCGRWELKRTRNNTRSLEWRGRPRWAPGEEEMLPVIQVKCTNKQRHFPTHTHKRTRVVLETVLAIHLRKAAHRASHQTAQWSERLPFNYIGTGLLMIGWHFWMCSEAALPRKTTASVIPANVQERHTFTLKWLSTPRPRPSWEKGGSSVTSLRSRKDRRGRCPGWVDESIKSQTWTCGTAVLSLTKFFLCLILKTLNHSSARSALPLGVFIFFH